MFTQNFNLIEYEKQCDYQINFLKRFCVPMCFLKGQFFSLRIFSFLYSLFSSRRILENALNSGEEKGNS